MGPREPVERDRRDTESGRRRRRQMTAETTARLATDYVAEMTSKEPEGVVALEQADDGGWMVSIEVVETHRIPASTDILAVYEADMDPEGELIGCRRVKRYARSQVGEK